MKCFNWIELALKNLSDSDFVTCIYLHNKLCLILCIYLPIYSCHFNVMKKQQKILHRKLLLPQKATLGQLEACKGFNLIMCVINDRFVLSKGSLGWSWDDQTSTDCYEESRKWLTRAVWEKRGRSWLSDLWPSDLCKPHLF